MSSPANPGASIGVPPRENKQIPTRRYTGLRMDEANRAQWEDIDFKGGWVEVRGTKTEGRRTSFPWRRF